MSASHPERPPFAQGYPDDPELLRLVAAFEAGDYARVNDGARALAESPDPVLRDAARDLASRTRPDSATVPLFVFAALLLASLTAYWITHDGPAGPPNEPKPAVEIIR